MIDLSAGALLKKKPESREKRNTLFFFADMAE